MDKNEIKKTSTEDLISLKKSITTYLKTKNLKKRNAYFILVSQNITEELKQRKLNKERENKINKILNESNLFPKENSMSAAFSIKNFQMDIVQYSEDKEFIQRRTKRSSSFFDDIDVPHFLNDTADTSKFVSHIPKPRFISDKSNSLFKFLDISLKSDFINNIEFDIDLEENENNRIHDICFDSKFFEISSVVSRKFSDDSLFTLD